MKTHHTSPDNATTPGTLVGESTRLGIEKSMRLPRNSQNLVRSKHKSAEVGMNPARTRGHRNTCIVPMKTLQGRNKDVVDRLVSLGLPNHNSERF